METDFNEYIVANEKIDESTNHLLSGNGHLLYLCTPETDKYKIYAKFLSGRKHTNAILITNEDLEKVKENLRDRGIENLTIASPSLQNIAKFFDAGGGKGKKCDFSTIIVDCTSSVQWPMLEPKPVKPLKYSIMHKRKKIGYNKINSFLNHEEREKFLSKLNCDAILCIYDISELSKDECRRIIENHSKAMIIKDNSMLITESFSANVANGFLEKFVKNELETIILSMVLKKPMCGIDIKKSIYQNFNVLLSSGTLYPMLHKLEKEGFLQSKLGFEKVKTYMVADGEKIFGTLNDHMQAKNFLNTFLRLNMQDMQRISLVYENKG